jgi:hypothetical protein
MPSIKKGGPRADVARRLPAVPMPPLTPNEISHKAEMAATLQELAALCEQRNLNRAVALAVEAAAGRGELQAHFAEIGRRFGGTLGAAEKRPALRLVGGPL